MDCRCLSSAALNMGYMGYFLTFVLSPAKEKEGGGVVIEAT